MAHNREQEQRSGEKVVAASESTNSLHPEVVAMIEEFKALEEWPWLNSDRWMTLWEAKHDYQLECEDLRYF